MPEETRSRIEVMTVYKIEADLMNVTKMGDEEARWLLGGPIMVHAIGRSSSHSWPLRDGQQCWIGDKVNVTIHELAPTKPRKSGLTPPSKDNR